MDGLKSLCILFVLIAVFNQTGICNSFSDDSLTNDEQNIFINFYPEVRVLINSPAQKNLQSKKDLLLIFYALPNGNTIEQTLGKKLNAGDDWHFDIQHIAAQTRFIRKELPQKNIIIALLETSKKSWPSWRKKFVNSDSIISSIINSIKIIYKDFNTKIVLSGHSGGGSFIFGFINHNKKIPDYVERFCFLDSNYGYDDSLHKDKIKVWLRYSKNHSLFVAAYDDRNVLINGKHIVSATGGTYYKSLKMLNSLKNYFVINENIDTSFSKFYSNKKKILFVLKENPRNEIFHTILIERNGFIHSILFGTEREEKNYKFWDERSYNEFIK